MAEAMRERGVVPECECFDLGIVRSVKMYEEVGILTRVRKEEGKGRKGGKRER